MIFIQAFLSSFEYFWINVVVSTTLCLIVSFFFFSKWKDVLMSSIIAIAVINIGEGMASMLLMSTSASKQDMTNLMSDALNTILVFTIARLISLALILVILRFRRENIGKNILPPIFWATFLFITMKDALWILLLTDSYTELSFYYWAAVIPLLPVSYILIFLTRRAIGKMISIQVDSKLLDEKNKYYKQQLFTMKQVLESQKTVRHDLNNKLSPLVYLAENGRSDELIQQVKKLSSLSMLEEIYAESGNITIDYVINLKLQDLENIGIGITCEINVPKDIDIAPFDLSTILGNLIDNAIEAVNHVKDKKWIAIQISYQIGFLIIKIANSFDGTIYLENERIISRKKETENHGFGLNSIQKISQDYNGEMRVEHEDKQFEVTVKLVV
ncbi:sensor histidine kinase [Carnobacterium gallinarum]|uniref:sensor histidine kinase n=1 Tax=Carnobacterium gallinarum TaxID=2749 RepID=UPI001FE227C3|nr:sensor histidine kinase [Carnobacterium gallinarum]